MASLSSLVNSVLSVELDHKFKIEVLFEEENLVVKFYYHDKGKPLMTKSISFEELEKLKST